MVLSFGVTTLPPRAIAEPLTVIVEFERALFGMLLSVLDDPEIIHEVNVLLVNVWFWFRYTSPGVPHNTEVPSLDRYLPAPVSPLITILLPDSSRLSPETSSSIFWETALTINRRFRWSSYDRNVNWYSWNTKWIFILGYYRGNTRNILLCLLSSCIVWYGWVYCCLINKPEH